MKSGFFDELKRFIGFGERDACALRELAPASRDIAPRVVVRFYDVLMEHHDSLAVLSDDEHKIERLKVALNHWFQELFSGVYDQAYYDSRIRIGRTHVRVSLPQRFMPLAIELIWDEASRAFRELPIADVESKLSSLHRLLILDLTIMLGGYQEAHASRIREFEHLAADAKVAQAQHFAELGQLAASLAHEIKNPLAGISGAIQIIGVSLDAQSPYKDIVRGILGQISRLDATVKDLLLYARPTPPDRRDVHVSELVTRLIGALRAEPSLRNVVVRYEGDDVTVLADERQFEQLLLNLLLNAAHASTAGAVVRVGAITHADQVIVFVQDRGSGMPIDVLEQAMEPFYTTKAKGTGLGLAICRRIAEAHGGRIFIESRPGEGTTVSVELPRNRVQFDSENR